LAKALRACAVLVVLTELMMADAAAADKPMLRTGPLLAVDAGTPVPQETGRPVCVRVGTRSEGWAWPSGRFIHWAKCKGVVPKCHAVGDGYEVEGWYASGALVATAHCTEGNQKLR